MFRLGSQAGLKPDEVLDLSLPVYQAVIDGYSLRLTDYKICAIMSGYYSGYYTCVKHQKPLSDFVEELLQQQKSAGKPKKATDVDVRSFLEQEERFKAAYAAQQAQRKG